MAKAAYYPEVEDPSKVGEYSPVAGAGGGYVWDAVLEYRVWCHPERGAPDLEDGSDYYYSFATAQSHSWLTPRWGGRVGNKVPGSNCGVRAAQLNR